MAKAELIDNYINRIYSYLIGNCFRLENLMKTKALDRAGRKAQIVAVLYLVQWSDDLEPKTVAFIAGKLNLAVSQKLRDMCNELVLDGHLQATPLIKTGRYDGKSYRINPSYKPSQISATINHFKNGEMKKELL